MPFIPFPPGTIVEQSALDVLRSLTHWFIAQDPTTVQLISRVRSLTGNGGFSFTDGPPRVQQIVKMIFPRGNSDGIVIAEAGQDRQYDFVMVGEWDAVIEKDDYWVDPDTEQKYIVTGLSPYNEYEVKAEIKSFGPVAMYG
jgi:hypothetical protein